METDKYLEHIKYLEGEVKTLKEKEKKLEHDLAIYHQIFNHLKQQFDQMKHELSGKK